MGAIFTLARKDIRTLSRDKFALFWIFAFPVMYALFFGSLFGGGDGGTRGRVSVAVVDEDLTEGSAAFIQRLHDHESVRVSKTGEGDAATIQVAKLDEARDAVRVGDKVAYVRVLPGFGDSPFAMFGGGEGATIEVGIDPSRKAEAGMLRGILMQTMFGGMSDSFSDRDGMLKELERGREQIAESEDLSSGQRLVLDTFFGALGSFLEDVDLDVLEEGTGGMGAGGMDAEGLVDVVEVTRDRGDEPQSAYEITFPSSMVWGLMSVALGFAIVIVRERTHGTLMRLQVAPISSTQILAGKALACFIMCQIVLVTLILFSSLALGVRVGNPALLVLAMVSTGACFTGLMMVSSVMGKTEQAVAGAAWGVMMPFAMIGGGMIPLIAMPDWLFALSDFSPFKWGIYSLEGAIWRGFTLTDMLLPCGILISLGAAFFAIGAWIFRRM